MHPRCFAGVLPPTVADYPFKGGTKIVPWLAPEKKNIYIYNYIIYIYICLTRVHPIPSFGVKIPKKHMNTLKPQPSPKDPCMVYSPTIPKKNNQI